MKDRLSKARRSWNMSRIRSRDTKPEIQTRSILHRLGYRFTVNGPLNRNLPGRPDIVLPRYRSVVFVHGCFWHLHKNCPAGRIPGTRFEWWEKKLNRNTERDRINNAKLRKAGWRVIIVWECQIKKNPGTLKSRLKRTLG